MQFIANHKHIANKKMIVPIVITMLSVVAVINGGIPYNEVDIVLAEGSESFERQIQQSLQTTKNFFARDDVKLIATVSGKVLNYVPFVGQFAAAIPSLQSALASETDFKDALSKAIPDAVQRSLAEEAIRSMQSTMQVVSSKAFMLQNQNAFRSDSKTAIVHDIHGFLDMIVNQFSNREAIFRKYPLVGLRVLFALSSSVAIFVPIEYALVPELAQVSRLSCKLEEVLLDYRQLASESRLKKTKITNLGEELNNAHMVSNVMGRAFNEFGYNMTNSGTITCQKGCEECNQWNNVNGCSAGHVCLTDLVSGERYYAYNTHSMYGCIFGYMELARHRVDEAFKVPIELMQNTCAEEIRNRPRPAPTGYGWWEIKFHDAFIYNIDDGSSCDTTGNCDGYIRLFVSEREVLKTETVWDRHLPYFGHVYRSPRMSKQSKIRIEMWDDDSGFLGSNDDLIMRRETTIDALQRNGNIVDRANNLVTTSSWRDEYPEY